MPPESSAGFDELIKDLSDSLDLTVFMVTHDLDTLYEITDRVAVLADRKVVAVGPGVSSLAVGDAVTAYFYLNCGYCRFCLAQLEPLCPNSPKMPERWWMRVTRLQRESGTPTVSSSRR